MDDGVRTEHGADVIDNPTESTIKEKSLTKVNAIHDSSLSRINLLDERQLIAAENFITKIMRSEKGGIKSVNDGLAVLMRAQDLNLPFSTSIEHIHVINGKTGVDIHIIKALLLKAGVTWDCTKDYAPLYEYTDGYNVFNETQLPDYCVRCSSKKDAVTKEEENKDDDKLYVYPVRYYKDFNGVLYKEYQLNSKFSVVVNQKQASEIAKQGLIPVVRVPNQPIDFVTEYVFTRYVNGQAMVAKSHFSYNEALSAGMFDKDTYKKYPRILIGHRAFTYGARDIASDVIMGCMETTELKIVNNMDIDEQDISI